MPHFASRRRPTESQRLTDILARLFEGLKPPRFWRVPHDERRNNREVDHSAIVARIEPPVLREPDMSSKVMKPGFAPPKLLRLAGHYLRWSRPQISNVSPRRRTHRTNSPSQILLRTGIMAICPRQVVRRQTAFGTRRQHNQIGITANRRVMTPTYFDPRNSARF